MTAYTKHFQTRATPQTEPIPGKPMVQNSAGGYSFAVDDWTRLDRFLVLGSEGGSYYISEKKLTVDNAKAVQRCIALDGARAVRRIVEISDAGRAPKNDPAVFALAMCAGLGDTATKKAALDAMPKVCRIGTHLFQFCEAVNGFRGWGRGLRAGIAKWYAQKEVEDLAHQVVKYQQRNGWSHRDVLRLCHPKAAGEPIRNSIYAHAVGKPIEAEWSQMPRIMKAADEAKGADAKTTIKLIRDTGLPRECVNTEHLTRADVWDALLEKMPMTAMIRNLGNMSKVGLIAPLSVATKTVCNRLVDVDLLKKARIHPLGILLALKTFAQGRGMRGSGEWTVVPQVTDALDEAFYKAFDFVEPTGKRWLLGVDVSGSMSSQISGMPISAAEGAAALSLTTAKVESQYYVHGFAGDFVDLGISPKMRLDTVLQKTRSMNFGSTDCALPMFYALKNKIAVDVFVVLTDNETWAGHMQPVQALQQYRQKMGIAAKLIVVGMAANEFTIADPSDAGMLDIAGFDAAIPQIMGDFASH